MSILPKELTTFEYYKNKLPMYLRSCDAFVEHFRIWYDILVGDKPNNGIINTSELLLSYMNIFNPNYLKGVYQEFDLLDKLGSIFNVRRKFSVIILNEQSQPQEYPISLNNDDFLLLIKAQIIKNYSNGSYEQMRKLYDEANLQIYFKCDSSGSVKCLLIKDSSYSKNVEYMFKAGLLTIQSMGINYVNELIDYVNLLIWDSNSTGWDEGVWAV